MSYGQYGGPPPPPHGGYGAPPGGGYGGPPGGGYGGPPGGGYGGPPGGPPGYGGGFSVNRGPRPPPPGADPELWNFFIAVDGDGSGAIHAEELQRALINGDHTSFEIDTVKMLMGIFDTDSSGTIAFHEFAGVFKYVKDWQDVFSHFDRDRSGTIDRNELGEALRAFKYALAPPLIEAISRKYVKANQVSGYGAAPSGITFDRFVRACVVVKRISETFTKLDTDNDGWVQLNYEQFMDTVLSLP